VVVMPDLFNGDPAPNTSAVTSEIAEVSSSGSLLDKLKVKAAEAAKSFLIDMWLARHTEAKVLPILHRVIDACKDEFADAVSHGGGIYAVGYCFGARYVLLLAAERLPHPGVEAETSAVAQRGSGDVEENKPPTVGPFIKAGALAHATLVSKEDFQGLKVPLSVVCVENDPLFPDEVRIAGEEYMNSHGVEHEVQVYPGVPHGKCLSYAQLLYETSLTQAGFAVVGEYDDPTIKMAQATAYDQMLKWLNDH